MRPRSSWLTFGSQPATTTSFPFALASTRKPLAVQPKAAYKVSSSSVAVACRGSGLPGTPRQTQDGLKRRQERPKDFSKSRQVGGYCGPPGGRFSALQGVNLGFPWRFISSLPGSCCARQGRKGLNHDHAETAAPATSATPHRQAHRKNKLSSTPGPAECAKRLNPPTPACGVSVFETDCPNCLA